MKSTVVRNDHQPRRVRCIERPHRVNEPNERLFLSLPKIATVATVLCCSTNLVAAVPADAFAVAAAAAGDDGVLAGNAAVVVAVAAVDAEVDAADVAEAAIVVVAAAAGDYPIVHC